MEEAGKAAGWTKEIIHFIFNAALHDIKILVDNGAAPGTYWLMGSQSFSLMDLAQERSGPEGDRRNFMPKRWIVGH